MINVYVIIPDKSSGDYFAKLLLKQNINIECVYANIHPRVIDGQISTSPKIIDDLNNVFKSLKDKTKAVVIACNTLQLWLPKIDMDYKKNIKIYTTFESCEWKYSSKRDKPIWLGTTPLVKKTSKFPTLLDINENETQDLVQELIWRVKMLYGDDFHTAPDFVKKDSNNKILQKLKIKIIKDQILNILEKRKIKKVILGCTELPMVFTKDECGVEFIDPANVLSEYVKSQSITTIFAGGTISSLMNKNKVKVGGKNFDLLERLQDKRVESINKINITKSEIVYSGLSENMTKKDFDKLSKKTIQIIKSGVRKIIITHGTDAMEHSARYLRKKVIKYLKKHKNIVLFTGANDSTDNIRTDAWSNLYFAINNGLNLPNGEVYIAFKNRFIKAVDAIKDYYFGNGVTYLSKNDPKYIKNTLLFESKTRNLIQKLNDKFENKPLNKQVVVYKVNKIRDNHDKFIKMVEKNKPKAILFILYHSGTANTIDPKSSVSKLVKDFTLKGIVCFGATETGEPTNLRSYETSIKLMESGLVPLYDLIYPVAFHKLKLLDLQSLDRKSIIAKMLNNLVGEIDENKIIKKDISTLQKIA